MTVDSTLRNVEKSESVGSSEASKDDEEDGEIRFEVTGCAAHTRLSPLVPSHWINESPYHKEHHATTIQQPPGQNTTRQRRRIQFLWENAPRSETKSYRDSAKCYSHLPNGTSILDDKWVLARLFASTHRDNHNPSLAVLESHCFRGLHGFQSFCQKQNLTTTTDEGHNIDVQESSSLFPDILDHAERNDTLTAATSTTSNKPPPPMWVIKDAGSNGAGGIWVVSPENLVKYLSSDTTPLLEGHRYVAQQYAWPPVLYGGKKCHVRVYGLLTSDGRAFVHKRAFLHVANDPFQKGGNPSNDEVHITNCCANSHKKEKFAGEICADFEREDLGEIHGTPLVPLKKFFPSIAASVSALAKRTMPYLKGGEANNGFEYLGMDFILSYKEDKKPVAYLLEVNAPPSQDTATGLPHAEDLHDDVIRDIMTLWVMPCVTGVEAKSGGWRCVHNNHMDGDEKYDSSKTILPSKAAILNKIRWAIFERKASKLDNDNMEAGEEEMTSDSSSSSINGKSHEKLSVPPAEDTITADSIASYARSQFPYFEHTPSSSALSHTPGQIFFENAGGSQVPRQVISSVSRSLTYRHRSVVGSQAKEVARKTLLSLVGGNAALHEVYLGPNATTLFELLSHQYVLSGFLKGGDEVIVCSENHLANANPWIYIAKAVGAKVKWWSTTKSLPRKVGGVDKSSCSNHLEDLLSERTRLVAVSHASNILGQIRDIRQICRTVKEQSHGCAHIIVDGVAAAPHIFPDITSMDADWYAVSCHKIFGPHLGCLVGKTQTVTQLCSHPIHQEPFSKRMELGTINYEACAGIEGLGEYFRRLATCESLPLAFQAPSRQTKNQCTESYRDRQEDCHGSLEDTCLEAAGIVDERNRNILSKCTVKEAYRRIRLAEKPLLELLRKRLQGHSNIRFIESSSLPTVGKIPVVGFLHRDIHSRTIVDFCSDHGIVCRSGTFLCTSLLVEEFLDGGQVSTMLKSEETIQETEIVRISLAHYNTTKEIEILMETLESISGW